MRTSTSNFKRWTSDSGIAMLRSVLRREIGVDVVARRPGIRSAEVVRIQHTIWPRRRGARRPSGTPAEVRRLADELEVIRDSDFPVDHLDRLDDPRFRGRCDHLIRLLAWYDSHERWNKWRRKSGVVPDLRGADLADLDLRHVDLRHARLADAQLAGAVMRTCDLRHADLRRCKMRHTDLSYADLSHCDLRGAELTETLLSGANLAGADLRRAWLIASFMNQADLRDADLRGAVIWGVGTWDMQRNAGTRQDDLLVVPGLEPLDYDKRAVLRPGWGIRVHDLEVAYFITMLIENPKIGHVINAAAEKIVLLLGRFVGDEAATLDALREALPRYGYVPVVFDFDEPDNRDTIETVAILAGLSSFVIANLSQPRSTPLEAHLIIPAIAVPFVPIMRSSEEQFAMFTALQRKYPWVLDTVTYRSAAGLVRRLKRAVIEPAERAARRVRLAKHPPPARRG